MKRFPLFLSLLLLSVACFAKPRYPFPKNSDQVWQNDLDLFDSVEGILSSTNTFTSTNSFSAQLLISPGTEALPGLAFIGVTNTGIYQRIPSALNFSVLGTRILEASSTDINFLANAVPNSNNGVSLGDSSHNWSSIFGSTVQASVGSAAVPSYTFNGDANTGIYRNGADTLGFSTGGSQAAEFTSSGQLSLIRDRLRIFRSEAGGLVSAQINNSDNSNTASDAALQIISGGESAGDPYLFLQVNGTTGWAIGEDNSDSNSLKIDFGSSVGSNSLMRFDTSGAINKPLQPSFFAVGTTVGVDVTGDGTVYTMPWSEIYDQAGNFASDTFTAPVTGRYLLQTAVVANNVLTTHTYQELGIITSNRSYYDLNQYTTASLALTYRSLRVFVIADMDANDTATVKLTYNGGTKTVDILNLGTYCYFSGSLIN